MIRSDIMYCIDTPLTFEALTAPELTYSVVHPLVSRYALLQETNMSVVFCLLLNRVHFLRDEDVTTAAVSNSRAELCEILATRVFRLLGGDMWRLAVASATEWPVYNGADPAIIAQVKRERGDDLENYVGNAIELAILGKARKFIKSSACHKMINAIWSGKCVYQAQSSHSILSDTYKRNPIHFYDPHKAPLLDHYRLKVPAIRSVLEYLNFLVLFILFAIAIEFSELSRLTIPEILFMIYGLGFSLEKIAAMQEHGIRVYFKGTWNGFDMAFVATYSFYATLRLYGVYHHQRWARMLAFDILAIIASFMFPRLAFVTLKDNLMVLSLRAMFMQFLILMLIAAFCFCGFLYALWTMNRNGAGYSIGTIAWWMLDLYFGLDASGFDRADRFHPVFGPVLMVTYACLSNTLLLTGMFFLDTLGNERYLMVLSLRAMFMQFLILMLIAAFCFCGFLYALWTMNRNGAGYSIGTIAWWMLDLYFGLDASGFDRADRFHPVFGPVLMVTYACLSNTLLLTVLVSILSNTFARINEDAAAEQMFRKAVSTIEGVKADFLFSYQPPINVLALCIMLPARYVLTPRWFHKVNVFVIRITNLPILLLVSLYERQAKKAGTTSFYDTLASAAEKVYDTLPRTLKRMSIFEGLAGPGSDIDTIFEINEQFDSALDTTVSDEHPDIRLNTIPTAHRRSSGSTTAKRPLIRQATTSYRSGSPSSAQRLAVPRLRVDSLLSKPSVDGPPQQAFTSPLAQMYPPMVDNIPEERSEGDHADDGGGGMNGNALARATGVSSAPFGRRQRAMSTLAPTPTTATRRGPGLDVAGAFHSHSTAALAINQPRKTSGPTLGEKGTTSNTKEPELSMSPDQLVDVRVDEPLSQAEEPPKVSEIEETEEDAEPLGVTMAGWKRRLDNIEERQERIEGLLEKIASKL
ncbi:hypothetical protein AN958_08829 [Leucoagaricus sp. SymC.cos]|nr:hypothetical protein AN958_08829 [Leucoagaricus sp. SymC.cos]